MNDIVKFLEDRLADDERIARAATQGKWEWSGGGALGVLRDWEACPYPGCRFPADSNTSRRTSSGHEHRYTEEGVLGAIGYDDPEVEVSDENAAHIALHAPMRVLRDIEGKRAIVTECADNLEVPGGWEYEDTPKLAWFTLRGLAAAWSDHPDYDQDWALTDVEEES